MPHENNQQPNKQMSTDQIMASLGLATRLSETLLKQQNPMQNSEEPMQEEQPLDLETAEPTEPTEEPEINPNEEPMAEMESKMEKMIDEKMKGMEERMDKMMVEMVSKMKNE